MEYIKIKEEYLEGQIQTEPEGLKFTITNLTVEQLAEKCKGVTKVEVAGKEKDIYGVYENMVFISALLDAEGSVTVTMKKKNNIEVEIERMQQILNEQAVVIADILYGGGEA